MHIGAMRERRIALFSFYPASKPIQGAADRLGVRPGLVSAGRDLEVETIRGQAA